MALLDTNQLKEYIAISCKLLKPASFAHLIRFMKSFFRWSHEEGILSKNLTSKIKEPKVEKRIPKYLTEREIEHLRESCHPPIEKAIFEFMFSTGCRIGEIVSLEKNHINWTNQSAIVRGKGEKEREVYLNTLCDIWLKRYMESRNDHNPKVFVTARQPHKMSVAQMRYIIKRISNRAEIKKEIHPHQLRTQLCNSFDE
ncbi:tyrosine-type recombinase/integrase [Psychrobacillus sp. NPDC093180]|uniref:tyrosine-type recombinase/integrase n=1 Tax=Psychrobacillus sp. NPDC093180 TaxID=3364489 RepID=UPI0037FC055A